MRRQFNVSMVISSGNQGSEDPPPRATINETIASHEREDRNVKLKAELIGVCRERLFGEQPAAGTTRMDV